MRKSTKSGFGVLNAKTTCTTHHAATATSVTGKTRPTRIPSAFQSTNADPRSNSTTHTPTAVTIPASTAGAIAFQYNTRPQSPPIIAETARVPPHIAHGNPLKSRNPQGNPTTGTATAFTAKIPNPIPTTANTPHRTARS